MVFTSAAFEPPNMDMTEKDRGIAFATSAWALFGEFQIAIPEADFRSLWSNRADFVVDARTGHYGVQGNPARHKAIQHALANQLAKSLRVPGDRLLALHIMIYG